MLADKTAARSTAPSCGRKCMDCANAKNKEHLLGMTFPTAPMLQLVGQIARDAKADHSGGGRGLGQRNILLGPAETPPSECRRLPLGAASGGARLRPPEPLRAPPRAVSSARCIRRSALRARAARNRRRHILRNQFSPAGLGAYARRLWQTARLSRLPLLGWPARGAVVRAHCRQRILSRAVARKHDEAAGRVACIFDSAVSPWPAGLRFRGSAKLRSLAAMAPVVAKADALLRAFHSVAGFSRS